MGLTPSAHNPVKVKMQVQENMNAPDSLIQPDLTEADPTQTLTIDLRILLKPIEIIPHPSPMRAIYNFALFSTSVLTSRIKIENLENIEIKYSQIAISRYVNGRVICLGHMSILTSCLPSIPTKSLYVEKMLRWIGGPRPITRMLCLYKVDEKYREQLKTNLEGLGFGIDFSDSIERYTDNTIILVQSNMEPDPGLIDFVAAGGGLIVCGVDDSEPKINPTISQLGLCFLEYPHAFFDDESVEDIKPLKNFEDLQDANLDEHIRVLKQLHQQSPDNIEGIKALATIIAEEVKYAATINTHYAIDICDSFGSIVQSYIQKDDGKYGISEISKILIKLICNCAQLVPLNFFSQFDFSNRFLGASMNSDCQQVTISLSFQDKGWYSTGLWIQPGYLSQVQFDTRVPNCELIIGCHVFNGLNNEPPWNRFPLQCVRKQVTDRFMEIASPYGGMVFFNPSQQEIIEKNRSIHVTFSDAVKYPTCILGKPDSWKNTYTEEVPWGEVITKTIIISARVQHINMMENMESQMQYIDSLINNIVENSGYTASRKFRLIFDAEFPQKMTNDYPITVDIQNAKCLLHVKEFSQELFEILARIAYTTIECEGLDKKLHTTIAYMLSFFAMVREYGEGIKDKIKCDSPGFESMSKQLCGKCLLFTAALSEARAAQLGGEDDVTDVFIEHLNLQSGIHIEL